MQGKPEALEQQPCRDDRQRLEQEDDRHAARQADGARRVVQAPQQPGEDQHQQDGSCAEARQQPERRPAVRVPVGHLRALLSCSWKYTTASRMGAWTSRNSPPYTSDARA